MLPAEFINKKHTENPEKKQKKLTLNFFPSRDSKLLFICLITSNFPVDYGRNHFFDVLTKFFINF